MPFEPVWRNEGATSCSAGPRSWDRIPEDQLLSAETLSLVREAIDGLPPMHRQVITMRDVDGFSSQEVCSVLGITEVNQQIVAVTLEAAPARALKARMGAPALEITRRYTDVQDRVVMASVGLYPSDRFSHNTKFRIQNTDPKETA